MDGELARTIGGGEEKKGDVHRGDTLLPVNPILVPPNDPNVMLFLFLFC